MITGGLGGLGLLAARQLAESDVSHLLLAARSARADTRLHQLLPPRVAMHLVSSDAADSGQVELLVDHALGLGVRLHGVLHAAGCSSDRTLRHMTALQLAVVLGPKAIGAARLRHAVLCASTASLLLYSSVTSALGNVGQTNYALANGVLDALAECNRAHGQAACSVQPLPVSGVGMGDDTTVARLEADLGGPFSLRPSELSAWLRVALCSFTPDRMLPSVLPSTQLAIPESALPTLGSMASRPSLAKVAELACLATRTAAPAQPTDASDVSSARTAVNRPSTGAALRAELLEEAASFVHAAHGSLVDADAPLVELGVDSISAMELRVRIEARTGVRLRNVDMLSDPSVAHLATLVEHALHARGAAGSVDGGMDAELAARPWLLSSVASGYARPPDARLTNPIVLLLSSPRSGSSLLQLCLNAHSGVYAGQELFLLPFESLDERRRCLRGTGFDEGLAKTLMELRGCGYAAAQASLDGNLGGEGTVSHACECKGTPRAAAAQRVHALVLSHALAAHGHASICVRGALCHTRATRHSLCVCVLIPVPVHTRIAQTVN
jgi:acyl carrier protein/NAD(P)-dependent dehydrogenase (short-subunit alcohol dehydrogenase family)